MLACSYILVSLCFWGRKLEEETQKDLEEIARRNKHCPFLSSVAKPPDLYGLVVSNITSDRLSLSWKTGEKAFDNFIVEVRESASPSQAMGRTVPGGARSTLFSGLKGNTRYSVKLYGSAGRKNSPALTTVARTGTALHCTDCMHQ